MTSKTYSEDAVEVLSHGFLETLRILLEQAFQPIELIDTPFVRLRCVAVEVLFLSFKNLTKVLHVTSAPI